MSSKRKAGQANLNPPNPYTGAKEYGAWSDTWSNDAAHQQLKASGQYDKNSKYAKQFAGFEEDRANSRVDNEKGWRQLSIDESARDPKAYAKMVNEWSQAGFDVRAIDMNSKYGGSNIAVRRSMAAAPQPAPAKPAPAKPAPAKPAPKPVPAKPAPAKGGGKVTAPGRPDPKGFKENYMGNMPKGGGLAVKDSMNAKGGTLNNSGDLTAGRDINLDNSVTNQNTLNHFGGDVRQFTYNAPGYNGGGGNGGGGTGDGSAGGQYPTMNSYKDPALNATPVSAATMAGFYQPSDSPAAAAKRTTLHSELNRSKQQKYQNVGSSVAKEFIQSADRFNNINTKALNANLAVQPFVDEARSNMITSDTFGDIWNFQPDSFQMADGFVKPEQPDFDKMFENITDKITGG